MPAKKTRSVEREALKQTTRLEAGLSATMHTLNPDRYLHMYMYACMYAYAHTHTHTHTHTRVCV